MTAASKAGPSQGLQLHSSGLKAREFDQIRELAYQYCGLNIHAGKEELVAARLGKVMRELDIPTFAQYYQYVTSDRSGQALAALVVGESAFRVLV